MRISYASESPQTVTDGKPQPATDVTYPYYVERSCGLLACSRSVRPWTTACMEADGGDYYEAAPLVDSLLDSI